MPLFENVEEFKNVSDALQWAIFIVALLIVIVAVISISISIWLFVKYISYNRQQNSAGLSGGDAARKILDDNDLKHIRVSTFGSLLFGNSYSHYFNKVRLRRLTTKKKSITSLAMGAEKSALAILDKNGDKDMKKRIALTPFMYFGPVLFIPIVLVGIAIDFFVLNSTGVATVISAGLGILLYVISFVLSIKVLKTEVKAQALACEIMLKENLATESEVESMKELYKIYNIQYVNDIILQFLELIMRVLMLIANAQNSSANADND